MRAFFLDGSKYARCKSELVQRLGELMRKLWNPRNFKGQVSPHEFMRAVISESGKRFLIDNQSDPADFVAWLLNQVHLGLTGGHRKRRSVVTDAFQGEMEVVTEAGTGVAARSMEDVVQRVPFLMLALDLPVAPVFQDASEQNIIPQVRRGVR